MKKIFSIIFLFSLLFCKGQTGRYNGWLQSGNILGSNNYFLGSTDDRSLIFKTNNSQRMKLDSSGTLKLYNNFNIDLGTSTPEAPRRLSFQPWVGLTSLPAIYLGVGTPTTTNFFASAADTNITILNAPKTFIFRTGNTTFLTAQSTFTSGGSIIVLNAMNNVLGVSGAELRRLHINGGTTGLVGGSTTGTQRDILVSAQTYTAPSSATITNVPTFSVAAPSAGANVTLTNPFSGAFGGNSNFVGKISIGSSNLTPSAVVHLAAGSSSIPAIQLTAQTYTTGVAGAIFYNATTGHTHIGNLTASGTFSAGSTGTFTGILNPAAGIKGTPTNDNATAGNNGEYVQSLIAIGSAITATTNVTSNVTSISLTAGDWDVRGNLNFSETISTIAQRSGGVTVTSETIPTDGTEIEAGGNTVGTTEKNSASIPSKRISINTTTTIYLVGKAVFSAGIVTMYGSISARRVR